MLTVRRANIASAIFSICFLLVASVLNPYELQAQTKPGLVSGILYRIHSGFLEVQTDLQNPKSIAMVKVNAATAYWNGRTDKRATFKNLQQGDEVMIETVTQEGIPVAQKVRFLHPGTS